MKRIANIIFLLTLTLALFTACNLDDEGIFTNVIGKQKADNRDIYPVGFDPNNNKYFFLSKKYGLEMFDVDGNAYTYKTLIGDDNAKKSHLAFFDEIDSSSKLPKHIVILRQDKDAPVKAGCIQTLYIYTLDTTSNTYSLTSDAISVSESLGKKSIEGNISEAIVDDTTGCLKYLLAVYSGKEDSRVSILEATITDSTSTSGATTSTIELKEASTVVSVPTGFQYINSAGPILRWITYEDEDNKDDVTSRYYFDILNNKEITGDTPPNDYRIVTMTKDLSSSSKYYLIATDDDYEHAITYIYEGGAITKTYQRNSYSGGVQTHAWMYGGRLYFNYGSAYCYWLDEGDNGDFDSETLSTFSSVDIADTFSTSDGRTIIATKDNGFYEFGWDGDPVMTRIGI